MKKTQKVNFRVVVEPSTFWRKDCEKELMRDCNDIAGQIRRHVDGVGHVGIEYDMHECCEHCGSLWTEESAIYNGGCCDADHAPFAAAEALIDFFAAMSEEDAA